MSKKEVTPFGETALEDMTFSEMMDAGIIDIAEVDDTVVVDQADLIGKPFILFEWDVKPSASYGGTYAVCRVKTQEGTRVFADGGVGIQQQLESYKNKMAKLDMPEFSPLYFHYGLRVSNYAIEIDGESKQARTYYFDNRPRP